MANELQVTKKEALEKVQADIARLQQQGRINFPANYSPANAIQAAWSKLQDIKDKDGRAALDVCTKASVTNALLKTVISGLNPNKDQIYYIPMGNQLTTIVGYLGAIALAKRHGMKGDPFAAVVYTGDEFEYEICPTKRAKIVTLHKQRLENIDIKKILAAYAIAEMEDGTIRSEIMTIEQIRKSWGRGQMRGNGMLHNDHTDQAAIKTVINRLCKMIIKASDDSDLILDTFDSNADDAAVEREIAINANAEAISLPEEQYEVSDEVPEEVDEQPAAAGPGF